MTQPFYEQVNDTHCSLTATRLTGAILPLGFKESLLATVELGAELYAGALRAVNNKREKRDRLAVLRPGDYLEQAHDSLSFEQLQAAALLPYAPERPLLVVPRPDKPLLKEEQLFMLAVAAKSGLPQLRESLSFLAAWSDNDLSGFEPGAVSDSAQFEILPTAYDHRSEGPAEQQRDELELLQKSYPSLTVAGLYHSTLLARYYRGSPTSWHDTQVRGVHLEPTPVGKKPCVPFAYAAGTLRARVGASAVASTDAARLVVRGSRDLRN